MKDTVDILSTLNMRVLTDIRSSVLDRALETFPDYKDHKTPHRAVVNTVVKDIWHPGYSITSGSMTKDAVTIFTSKGNSNGELSTSSFDTHVATQLQELLETVIDTIQVLCATTLE